MEGGCFRIENAHGRNIKMPPEWLQQPMARGSLWLQLKQLLRKMIKAIEPILLYARCDAFRANLGHQFRDHQRGERERHQSEHAARVAHIQRKERFGKEKIQTSRRNGRDE